MDISQGNVVTPKMMMQLRPGMSKAQVKFIMGTPLIVDAFHANRWDYFYQMRKDGKIVEQRRVIMEFENEKLARIRGDVIPAATTAGEGADKPANKAPVTLKSTSDPKPKEKGLLDSLKFWGDDETAAVPPAKPETPPVAEPANPAVAPAAAKAAPETGKAAPAPAEAPASLPATPVEAAPTQAAAPEVKPEVPAEAPAPPPVPPVEAAPTEAVAPVVKPPVAEPPAPVAQPKAATTAAPEPQTSAPPSRPESSGAQIQLQPKPQQDPLPVIEPKPAPKAAPVTQSLPETGKPEPSAGVTAPAAAPAPARKAVETAAPRASSVEPKAVPKPAEDLPPEDAPDYFERMLEKIGF
ncbi:MAG: outer membrane protein assembly factor BamE [Methylobacterium sp.]|nr:outer membrane protein assembly factor BamE [Methylobacterium sp.]